MAVFPVRYDDLAGDSAKVYQLSLPNKSLSVLVLMFRDLNELQVYMLVCDGCYRLKDEDKNLDASIAKMLICNFLIDNCQAINFFFLIFIKCNRSVRML